MEALLFKNLHRKVLEVARLWSYPIPWLEETPKWKTFYKVYYNVLFVLTTYMLVCVVASICFLESIFFMYIRNKDTKTLRKFREVVIAIGVVACRSYISGTFPKELKRMMVVGPLVFCALYTNLYFQIYREEFEDLMADLDQALAAFETSPIGRADRLAIKLQSSARIASLLTYISVYGIAAAAVFFIIPVPFPGLEREAYNLPLITGFHGTRPRSDPISVAWKAFTLTLLACKKTALDCFFYTLFSVLVIHSKHMNDIMQNIPYVAKTSEDNYHYLLEWIKLHQMLDRNNRKLISLYAPIIILYYVHLLTIVGGAFFILLADRTDLVQASMDFLWILSLLFLLYLQSTVSADLGVESEKMAQGVYSLPFYQLGRECGATFRMAIMYTNRPIMVTAYRAQVFVMNRESFVAFVASAISFYITFNKIHAD